MVTMQIVYSFYHWDCLKTLIQPLWEYYTINFTPLNYDNHLFFSCVEHFQAIVHAIKIGVC
jgi:hypothetical protein